MDVNWNVAEYDGQEIWTAEGCEIGHGQELSYDPASPEIVSLGSKLALVDDAQLIALDAEEQLEFEQRIEELFHKRITRTQIRVALSWRDASGGHTRTAGHRAWRDAFRVAFARKISGSPEGVRARMQYYVDKVNKMAYQQGYWRDDESQGILIFVGLFPGIPKAHLRDRLETGYPLENVVYMRVMNGDEIEEEDPDDYECE
jgi:hypothetical protein